MTKAPTPTKTSEIQRYSTNNATKDFDYTTSVDRLRTVIWSNDSNPMDVFKPVNGIPTCFGTQYEFKLSLQV